MTRVSVFLAASLDGYIATADDDLSWLEAAARPDEDYGYDAFLATVDALAMGRGTYDHIADLDPLPFGNRPLYVFTHRPPAARPGVTFWELTPRDALRQWESAGLTRVYVDGGRLLSAFLDEGLVDDLQITAVPLLLGGGRPLFHPLSAPTQLVLEDVQAFPSGMVNLRYRRACPRSA
jgi:dihydrofolate reductase